MKKMLITLTMMAFVTALAGQDQADTIFPGKLETSSGIDSSSGSEFPSHDDNGPAGLESEKDSQLSIGDKEKPKPKKALLARFNEIAIQILFFDVSRGIFKIKKTDRQGVLVLSEDGTQVVNVIEIPLMIGVLIFGGLFFTIWFRFINIRAFKHSIDVIRGKFDRPDHNGEITHFRALTSALSATVGLGNIAGVAIAIQMGGPGAVFWMVLAAIFGMTAKFSSCTLSQMYRKFNTMERFQEAQCIIST